jgi:hypothetical protein
MAVLDITRTGVYYRKMSREERYAYLARSRCDDKTWSEISDDLGISRDALVCFFNEHRRSLNPKAKPEKARKVLPPRHYKVNWDATI